jgi:CRISPR-associated protein (TIGR03986 family)
MITAPFNFVPLSEKVFFPSWADSISHDVPFEDSQSGVIDITIRAKSPIFIRDGKEETRFCNHNGTPYIPSSSVKGMIRNVLEIMSFSKMSMFNDDTYAVRDLRNRELYMSKMTPDKTFCGWLKKVDNEYYIEDCGKAGRIRHEEIDAIYNINFASKFKHGRFGNKAKDKTAKIKYELLPKGATLEHNFSYVKKDVNREIYRYEKRGSKKGTVVFTGQPSARKEPQGQKPSGKIYEFVFFDKTRDIKLTKSTFQNFLFAYFDERTTEPKESPDWSFWKKKLEHGGKVPVFFQKNGSSVAHFGLSYLYKLPYTNSVSGGIPLTHTDDRKDLSEAIFGYIGKDKALKGRVQFSHFKANGRLNQLEWQEKIEVLGTPRASYYPMYVKQKDGRLFTTFMDNGFSISGRKRYPIQKGVQSYPLPTTKEGKVNRDVATIFTPLKKEVLFYGKVRYHNLKKAELGALLSALTFHNTQGCFHNIGMAKSLGYGKIELKIDGIEPKEYLKAFETEITASIPNWTKSEQLTELVTMATEQNNSGNSKLHYMELKEFASNKTGDKNYLKNYTALDNIKTTTITSLISKEDLDSLKLLQTQRAKEEREAQEQKALKLKEEQEWEIVADSSNIATIEAFIKKYPNSDHIEKAKIKIAKIEEDIENLKLLEGQKEAIEKWEAVLRVEKKYKRKALEDYIQNYPNSPKLNEAKKELEQLKGSKPKATNQVLDFSNAKDVKSIERAMKGIQNPTETDKDKLEKAIRAIYPTLNTKKKKQFLKSKLMVRWLGQKRFETCLQTPQNNT